MPSPKQPLSSKFPSSPSHVHLDIPTSTSSSTNSHPSLSDKQKQTNFKRSPSPSYLPLPSLISRSSSSYLPMSSGRASPSRRPSSSSLLSLAPSSPLGQTFGKITVEVSKLVGKLSSPASRIRKQSILGLDDQDHGGPAGEGLLPTTTMGSSAGRAGGGGRKGWRASAGEILWYLCFWTAVVVYLRALGGFGAQEALMWEDMKVSLD